jgi:hypothetical protein
MIQNTLCAAEFFAVKFEFLIVSGDIKWSGSSGGTGI